MSWFVKNLWVQTATLSLHQVITLINALPTRQDKLISEISCLSAWPEWNSAREQRRRCRLSSLCKSDIQINLFIVRQMQRALRNLLAMQISSRMSSGWWNAAKKKRPPSSHGSLFSGYLRCPWIRERSLLLLQLSWRVLHSRHALLYVHDCVVVKDAYKNTGRKEHPKRGTQVFSGNTLK